MGKDKTVRGASISLLSAPRGRDIHHHHHHHHHQHYPHRLQHNAFVIHNFLEWPERPWHQWSSHQWSLHRRKLQTPHRWVFGLDRAGHEQRHRHGRHRLRTRPLSSSVSHCATSHGGSQVRRDPRPAADEEAHPPDAPRDENNTQRHVAAQCPARPDVRRCRARVLRKTQRRHRQH